MDASASIARRIARFMGEVAAETLWPTRCALCDMPGSVLCDACASRLPYLDWWKACKRCGSPFGAVQCDLCNPVSMKRIGRDELPFSRCAAAVMFTARSGQVVRVFKDQGEQRLAAVMAQAMARCVSPDWHFDAVTFVPATKAAYSRRGFDHGELLGAQTASCLEAPLAKTLQRPRTQDQRSLSGAGRIENLGSGFCALPNAAQGMRLLLVDDVMTTGSTLCAATDALLAAGAFEVHCLTFARV